MSISIRKRAGVVLRLLFCTVRPACSMFNERYRHEAQRASSVCPTRLCFHISPSCTEKTQRAHHALAPWLGVWFACSLWSAFSGLARSALLDPSACSLNVRGARSPTNSALFISHVSRFCCKFSLGRLWRLLSRRRENSQQKRET